ncbi:lipopolysaccharide assembly protein LapA domain-containing protein [Actinacidiphila bryophytorum]|uniref:LapA_dom domain-containing protein n=1 Tax=Actinacidiphila bryophytorum TaxID=1436133 RepID=A0A9W4MJV6_9ACTN|nr:LapA family protein [Actinacidiphila bryophytorum]MBM9439605.1 LapA family protein [Actinacidiphila bryophytorum]MBN6543741.1 LapA family protein [Actinacidiphila bryophytorum]CAG7653340.1 LapA_dom domain-containing protein [Actinacidiphila bryophytorum]
MTSDKAAGSGLRERLTPGRIVVLVLGALALVFVFENTQDVRIRLLVPEVTMPLWLALLATFVVGWLCGRFLRGSRRR